MIGVRKKSGRSAADKDDTVADTSLIAMMKAAEFQSPGSIRFKTMPKIAPGPNELLVRLEGCGVCGSNFPVWEGRPWFRYPFEPGAPGHEGWGRVECTGEAVEGFHEGERVAILSYHAYAEYDVAPADMAVKLPEALDTVPFPGEPLACACNAFTRSAITANDTVAIVGIGFLGALLTALASRTGARVIAISRREFALDTALRFGASEAIVMDDHWEIINKVKRMTGDRLCDVVIEAVGLQWPLDIASELTKERGRLVVAGYHQDGPRSINMQQWNWRGIDVINAHERDPRTYVEGMKTAVELVASGSLDPAPLFTHTFALEDLPDAFELMSKRPDGFMKALVKI